MRRFNGDGLGAAKDLDQFLFGAERESLNKYLPILREAQEGRCLYCEQEVSGSAHIDHFIPWSRYPIDLGHNFVLAHGTFEGSIKGVSLEAQIVPLGNNIFTFKAEG